MEPGAVGVDLVGQLRHTDGLRATARIIEQRQAQVEQSLLGAVRRQDVYVGIERHAEPATEPAGDGLP